MARNRISDCRIVDLPRILDPRGSLTFVEATRHVPFDIQRVFFIYDIPSGESRGAHAHRELHQLILCLSGGFSVEIDDGASRDTIRVDRPWRGLHIPPLIWARQQDFDPASVCLSICSAPYSESDYIRDYEEYCRIAGAA
jgi:hypothetical protein